MNARVISNPYTYEPTVKSISRKSELDDVANSGDIDRLQNYAAAKPRAKMMCSKNY